MQQSVENKKKGILVVDKKEEVLSCGHHKDTSMDNTKENVLSDTNRDPPKKHSCPCPKSYMKSHFDLKKTQANINKYNKKMTNLV